MQEPVNLTDLIQRAREGSWMDEFVIFDFMTHIVAFDGGIAT